MGFMDRLRAAAGVIAGKFTATWDYRTGSATVIDGTKFKGASHYPAAFDVDSATIRAKSRFAYWDSTLAQGLLGRLVDNAVGTGLTLESTPVWELIGDMGLDEQAKHKISRNIELRFNLWANSLEPDAAGRWNFYQAQAIEYLNRLRDGETYTILRYSTDSKRMSPLNLQSILPEQIVQPYDSTILEAAKKLGHRIIDGVEIDQAGREIAIYVATDVYLTGSKTQRIPFFSESGRRYVLHPINADTLGAVRGTPLLANCVHELEKITDYTVAEIEAAIINAVLAVWVEPSADAGASRALGGIQRRGQESTSPASSTEAGHVSFDKPGLIVQSLKAGEKLQSFDTKRPNVNFGEFVRHIARGLGASKGVPIEVLEQSFSANYSASRASLLLFWQKIEIERGKIASQYLGPIFEAWFVEEIKAGRIMAQGFDDSPIIKRAWLASTWNGARLPSIDPLKEANADGVRIAQGVTTRERVAMEYNGSDAMENISKLAVENQALANANAPLEPVAPDPMEPDADDEKNDNNEAK